jgi:hypothetical protein
VGNARIKLNHAAIARILKVDVRPILEDMGADVARAAGPGHRVESEVGRNRARVAVITDTHEARVGEATDRTLTRAIAAARR